MCSETAYTYIAICSKNCNEAISAFEWYISKCFGKRLLFSNWNRLLSVTSPNSFLFANAENGQVHALILRHHGIEQFFHFSIKGRISSNKDYVNVNGKHHPKVAFRKQKCYVKPIKPTLFQPEPDPKCFNPNPIRESKLMEIIHVRVSPIIALLPILILYKKRQYSK